MTTILRSIDNDFANKTRASVMSETEAEELTDGKQLVDKKIYFFAVTNKGFYSKFLKNN